ncbi:MAG: hypothetical protein AB1499_13990 [Nitrospirota bacterium]
MIITIMTIIIAVWLLQSAKAAGKSQIWAIIGMMAFLAPSILWNLFLKFVVHPGIKNGIINISNIGIVETSVGLVISSVLCIFMGLIIVFSIYERNLRPSIVPHDDTARKIYTTGDTEAKDSNLVRATIAAMLTLFLGFIGTLISRLVISNIPFSKTIIPVLIHFIINLIFLIVYMFQEELFPRSMRTDMWDVSMAILIIGTIYFMVKNCRIAKTS